VLASLGTHAPSAPLCRRPRYSTGWGAIRLMLGNPVLREFGYRVPAASFALAGCFATGRKTCSAKPHSDSPSHSRRKRTCRPPRCSASPSRRRGTGGIASRIDIPCHLCQRLSSGIKETVLRDRTEFPVKHAQLLDQEPPSQREFSHKMPGLRVANTGGARYENEPHDRHVENATVPVDICWWSFPGVGGVVRPK
jgi:hypothetical protein